MFIRVQNAKKDEKGNIIGGSASLVESIYVKGGNSPTKQRLVEKLGSIVFMPDRRSGIFLTPDRGLVEYDLDANAFSDISIDDPRLEGREIFPEPRIHTLFGDCDAVLSFMKSEGIIRILRNLAVDDDAMMERMLCHILHCILRDGANITCDRFIERSFVSNIINVPSSTLRTDSRFYQNMGTYELKLEFFRQFTDLMRKRYPDFGKGCYVDSTPLSNDISNFPLNRLCSHGTNTSSNQVRLVLILDISTGLPVWFDLIPGNVLDLSTIMDVSERVSRALGIRIEDFVLDAGYVCRSVIEAYNLDDNPDKTLIARMPNKNGYNMEKLFHESRNLFSNAKYSFVRKSHTYFGIRREVEIFGKREYAYIYVDDENASDYYKTYLSKHRDKYDGMTMKDRNRVRYEGGFFVLVSNVDTTPEHLLDLYYGRTEIETVFLTAKEHLKLLPLNKQEEDTVRGKIMQDMIALIAYLQIRQRTVPTGRSVSDYIYDLQSVMAYRSDRDTIKVEFANKQAKAAYGLLGEIPPASISIAEYRKSLYLSV